MTDWPKLIRDLRGLGVSSKGFERLAGVPVHVVYDLMSGRRTQPTHDQGERINWLHSEMQKICVNGAKVSGNAETV